MEYRVEYGDVGKAVAITPRADTQPIADFARELQRILSER